MIAEVYKMPDGYVYIDHAGRITLASRPPENFPGSYLVGNERVLVDEYGYLPNTKTCSEWLGAPASRVKEANNNFLNSYLGVPNADYHFFDPSSIKQVHMPWPATSKEFAEAFMTMCSTPIELPKEYTPIYEACTE